MIAIMSMSLFDRLHQLSPTQREFDAGALLFRRGDEISVLHLVLDGEAHLIRHRADGGMLVLQRAAPKTVLAEASVFSERYHCDCVAVVPTRTHAVSRAAVRALLAEDSVFAESWAHHLSHELQATRLRAEILSLRTVRERFDAWMDWNGDCLPQRGTWNTIASEIGTSPEALYREIARRRKSTRGPGSSPGCGNPGRLRAGCSRFV